jgi:hypothetical protein
MSSLGTYYYMTAILFLVVAICDIAFYSQFSLCPIDNSATPLFLFLIIINFFLIFFLLLLGILVNYFDQLDPDELLDLNWIKRLGGVLSRVCPTICKILHYIKVLIVLICAYFAFFNNQTGTSYLTSDTFNATKVDQRCLSANTTYLKTTLKNYPTQVVIFGSIEFIIVFITLCVLGIVKNLIDIDGYFYEPEDFKQGGCRKLLFRRLGP